MLLWTLRPSGGRDSTSLKCVDSVASALYDLKLMSIPSPLQAPWIVHPLVKLPPAPRSACKTLNALQWVVVAVRICATTNPVSSLRIRPRMVETSTRLKAELVVIVEMLSAMHLRSATWIRPHVE